MTSFKFFILNCGNYQGAFVGIYVDFVVEINNDDICQFIFHQSL